MYDLLATGKLKTDEGNKIDEANTESSKIVFDETEKDFAPPLVPLWLSSVLSVYEAGFDIGEKQSGTSKDPSSHLIKAKHRGLTVAKRANRRQLKFRIPMSIVNCFTGG